MNRQQVTVITRRYSQAILISAMLISGVFGSAESVRAADADLAVIHAKIWTGVEASPTGKNGEARGRHAAEPTALAVRDGEIIALGDDDAVRTRIGPGTKVIDAEGRRVIPGITDSHVHLINGGLGLSRLYLRDVGGRAAFIEAVETSVKSKRPGEWVLGGRWSTESWKDPQAPDRSWIDPFTKNTPVLLSRMDGHQALVNSAALSLAGISATGPADPVGGEIVRDPTTGEPTGILRESAMNLVSKRIPEPSTEERYQAMVRAMQLANSQGITCVHDMSNLADLEVYRRGYDQDALTLRVISYVITEDWAGRAYAIAKTDLRHDMLSVVGLKGFMDGSLGSRTAYMREPYADATRDSPYPRGQLTEFASSTASFHEQMAIADGLGLQLAVHAIGDQANHLALDAYEENTRRRKDYQTWHRIEHAQHLFLSDIPRFTELGIVASMQPYHKADDGRYAEKALGHQRLAGAYAFRQLLDAHALVCFGSDWPVVTLNPFLGIDSAVNAKTLDGKVWLPSHSISVEEALYAYTAGPAQAVHREDRWGTLEVGKLADMVILGDDLLTIPKERIGAVKVWRTIVGGKVVFASD